MPKMVTIACKCCGKPKEVRHADVKRGWGLFCSKSCKAKYQTKTKPIKSRQHKELFFEFKSSYDEPDIEDTFHPHDPYSLGQE